MSNQNKDKRYILTKEFDEAVARVGIRPYSEINKNIEKLAKKTLKELGYFK